MNATAHTPLRLSELQQQLKLTLAERFALPVWVVAEVSDLKVNYSGHCYLELVEKGASDGVPKAQVRATIWRSHYPRLAGRFEAETGQPLGPGMQLLVKATINYHELYGLSLTITEIDSSYTLGDMERQRQAAIAQLKKEGVWALNKGLEMPPVVQRIAVVSSRQAAGYQDFCNELARSPYRFEVELFDAYMQGDAAEDSVVAALYAISERLEDFDAVAVIRGGGSVSDLNCFNTYRMGNHIAQFPLPVLTGIGHDKDVSVADLVAHTALKTPTAVAGWLVERMQQVEGWLEGAALRLHEAAVSRSREELLRLERMQSELHHRTEELLKRQHDTLQLLEQQLPESAQGLLTRAQEQLQRYEELIESRSPSRILRLGFSIVRRRGEVAASAQALHTGDKIEIEFHDHKRTATVD